jgi:hexulose-6-phosphate isomerase
MQGRLVPPIADRLQCFPRGQWRQEFARAVQAGLDSIEWIYDDFGADVNPLASDEGVAEILCLAEQHGVCVRSICADYFMDHPLVRAELSALEERLCVLEWLLERGKMLEAQRIVLPFVDASQITSPEEARSVAAVLGRVLDRAESARMEIHLETSLPPEPYADLLALLPHPMLKVNYDSGNSASLGYAPYEEFSAYGERVGSVHIKDRLRAGGTVALGKGDTDFAGLFACLRKMNYEGDLILQVARGAHGEEVDWSRRNREFVLRQLSATV